MADETPVVQPEPEQAAAAIRHYCPICANVMYITEMYGMQGWYCDECFFFDPIL